MSSPVQIGTASLGDFGIKLKKELLSGKKFNAKRLRTNNSLLTKDEWTSLDNRIIQVARIRLRAVGDLQSRGYQMTMDGMSNPILQWQTMSRTFGAEVSMDPRVIGDNQTVSFNLESLPLPVIHTDYSIPWRQLQVSRTSGAPLDTTIAAQRTQDIAEKVEDILVNGLDGWTYGGATIRGYLDTPNSAAIALTNWYTATDGQSIVSDILKMKQALIDKKKYGPYLVYIPTKSETVFDNDYRSGYSQTTRARVDQIDDIEELRVLDTLPDDKVIMVQLSPGNVEMINGLPMTNINWETKGGQEMNFKIMTIMVPRFLSDQEGNLGVSIGTISDA